jgi:hypothetical protein
MLGMVRVLKGQLLEYSWQELGSPGLWLPQAVHSSILFQFLLIQTLPTTQL